MYAGLNGTLSAKLRGAEMLQLPSTRAEQHPRTSVCVQTEHTLRFLREKLTECNACQAPCAALFNSDFPEDNETFPWVFTLLVNLPFLLR